MMCVEVPNVSWYEAVISTDLGGSSKYSNEILDG